MKAQQSAYVAGFAVGLRNGEITESPYKGPTTGFHRGLSNSWKRGFENGNHAYLARLAVDRKRDEATNAGNHADNAFTRDDLKTAHEFLDNQHRLLRGAADDLKFYINLIATRDDPEKFGY